MTVMKSLAILLAFATCGTGIWAAWKWHMSSQVSVELGFAHPPLQVGGPPIPETEDAHSLRRVELAATWDAMNQTAYLNKLAAFWTAVSVALSAATTIVGIGIAG
jgi:hypothetical protein